MYIRNNCEWAHWSHRTRKYNCTMMEYGPGRLFKATTRHWIPAAVKIIKFWKGNSLEADMKIHVSDSVLLSLFMSNLSRLMTKPTNWLCAQRISLAIGPVWSESSLCAKWVAKDPSFLHADGEDSDQTGRMRFCHKAAHMVNATQLTSHSSSFSGIVYSITGLS